MNLHPTLYRAEPYHEGLLKPQRSRSSVRLPSNVPYVVDNLWNFLRPDEMPDRRHSLYASPTARLAVANRSGKDKGQGYCVFRLAIDGPSKLAQLRIKDAREHSDIGAVMKLVQELLPEMNDLRSEQKLLAGVLFRPGAQAAEWRDAQQESPFVAKFVARAEALSTFWTDAKSKPSTAEGELFIELLGGSFSAADLKRYSAAKVGPNPR